MNITGESNSKQNNTITTLQNKLKEKIKTKRMLGQKEKSTTSYNRFE